MTQPFRRTGFTMVELLVVIAIIAILMALTAAAVFRVAGGQQMSNSRNEVAKLQEALKNQIRVVRDQAMNPRNPVPQQLRTIAQTLTTGQTTDNDPKDQRARTLYFKFLMQQEFPMNFYEVYNPPAFMPASPYLQQVKQAGVTASIANSTPGKEDSAICLALALTRQRGGSDIKLSDLVSNTTKSTTYPTLNMLVDGWGNPLGFYRWPTDNTDLNPNGPVSGTSQDTDDPQGLLMVPAWVNAPYPTSLGGNGQLINGQWYASLLHKVAAGKSYALMPVLVSGGRDGAIGVQSPAQVSTPDGMAKKFPDAADDIYSYAP